MAVWSLTTLRNIRATRRIDSEFFRPEYVDAEQRVRRTKTDDLGKLGGFVPGPFGSAFHTQNYDYKSPYRYIRGRDVKPFFLLNDDNRYIPESDFRRLRQYEVRNDDLMVSVVGTLGNVSVCTDDDTPAMFSCKSTLLRALRADPYFLLAYLNSATGQLCMFRRQRGAIQTGLNIEDLRTIPVPRFGPVIEDEIAASIRKAHSSLLASRDAYETAQRLLETELGLDRLTFQKPVGYAARFSEVQSSLRIDSEHFYPEFDYIKSQSAKVEQFVPLGIDLEFCRRGKQPVYATTGMPVINSKHVRINQIVIEGNRRALRNPIHDLNIRQNDLLLNGTGVGTIGRAAAYLAEDGAVPDNHVTILRTRTLDPVYLSVFLNSRLGQSQVRKHQRGSSGQLELYPYDISRFLVWQAPQTIQREIRNFIVSAHEAQRHSQQLLEQAKTRVEQLIEEAVQP